MEYIIERSNVKTVDGVTVPTVEEDVRIVYVTSTSITISDLQEETPYPIRLRAKNNTGASEWSGILYAYPTKTTVGPGSTVRTIEITGHLDLVPVGSSSDDPPVGDFTYILCGNTLPADDIATKKENERNITATQIMKGVEEWSSKTGVSSDGTVETCSSDELTIKVNQDESINKVQLSSPGMVWSDCETTYDSDYILNGCKSSGSVNPVTRVYIFLNNTLDIRENKGTSPGKCSTMFQISMHEAGHVYGLGHSTSGDTTMRQDYNNHRHICSLTLSDVIAITRIYQSR